MNNSNLDSTMVKFWVPHSELQMDSNFGVRKNMSEVFQIVLLNFQMMEIRRVQCLVMGIQ